MKRVWELILIVIILAVMLEQFVAFITPLMPYIIVAALLLVAGGLIGGYAYRRNRNW
jgi:hypothetical protein